MKPPVWHIATLRPDQIDALGTLARTIWLQHYPGIISLAQIDYMLVQRYHSDAIRAQLGQAGLDWTVAQTVGELIGFAHAFPITDALRFKLDKLYVHPDWQRRGVGAALLNQVESAARQHDCTLITLRTNRHNHIALAAYRRYGFVIRAEVVTNIGAGFVMDDFVLEKNLRNRPD